MLITSLALGQQNDRRGRHSRSPGSACHTQINLTADNRLNPGIGRAFREFQGAEHIVRVGDRDSRHTRIDTIPGNFFTRIAPSSNEYSV